MTGSMSVHGVSLRLRRRTLSQTGSVHLPVLPGSYFDCFIASIAACRSPAWFGLGYGSYVAVAGHAVGGSMDVAMSQWIGPPHAFWSACLSMMKFTAFRTLTSSNGGTSRFIVMYQVRSPESACSSGFRSGFVRYCASMAFGGVLAHVPSSSPDCTLLKMSVVFVSIEMTTPSRFCSRTVVLSLDAS